MTALGSEGGGGGSPRRVRPAALLLACAALAAGSLVAGCGASGSEASSQAAAPARASDAIEIADFAYDRESATVKAGTEVTWTNSDEAAHTATADDGSFDTGTLKRGEGGSVTLGEPGTFTYYCRFHPFMKATVEVI